ncbi:type II toxin-antitoxin system RelE/ParE family toxin [Phyllobacterium sp. K27]
MPALEWRETARADLLAIMDYISDNNPTAAQRLKNEIEMRVLALAEYPRLCKIGRVEGTRELIIRANYILVYTESEQTISILRILHAARQWP